MQKIVLEFDEDNFTPIIEKMYERKSNEPSFAKPFESIFQVLNSLFEFSTVYDGDGATLAIKLLVSLNPTDGFRVYSTAFLVLDFDSFIVEHNKFLLSLKKI